MLVEVRAIVRFPVFNAREPEETPLGFNARFVEAVAGIVAMCVKALGVGNGFYPIHPETVLCSLPGGW